MLPVDEYKEGAYLLMATVNGLIKKTPLKQFQDVRANGLIAMKLKVGLHTACHHIHMTYDFLLRVLPCMSFM